MLYQSGDVEKNPGPEDDNISDTASSESFPVYNANFSVVHYNVQSVKYKLDIIEPEFSNFSVVALTETWLNELTTNQDLVMNNFQTPFRRDRDDSHGGILVYIKDGIPCKRRADLELHTIECVWVEANVRNKRILIGTFYRPPESSPLVLSDIENSIGLAVDTRISDIVILGDFNFNMLAAQSQRKISDLCQQYGLQQLINEPTNFTEKSATIIDLIMVSNKNTIDISGVGEPFLMQNIRYHCPIYCIFKFKKHIDKPFSRKIWLYDQGNYDDLRQMILEYDWKSVSNDDVNTYANQFSKTIVFLAEQCIPTKHVMIRPRDLPWINSTIRRMIRKRNRLYKKYKNNRTLQNHEKFKQARNDVTSQLRKAKKEYTDSLAHKLKTSNLSPRDYWKTLKSFIRPTSNVNIPPLLHDDMYVADNNEKATILNNYFVQQTVLDEHLARLPEPDVTVGPTLNNIVFTEAEVKDVLNSLKLGKATGHDNINHRILKEAALPLAKPLCDLFNYSMSKCICPDIWKEANVTPIFKKDDPSIASNYRPISLLSAVGKVMEKVIHKHMFNFFKDHEIITSLQSGFVPGDSTSNQLVDIYNTFCKALDDNKEVRAIFCDISKAFDRVWHKGLLFKLKQAGISASLLQWLANYLLNRKQRVLIPGGSSDWLPIGAGVPQGSILGPLLFLIYINDIVMDIGSTVRLFADDTSLYIIVDDPVEAARCLNLDLERIHRWAERWLVKFNAAKSESLLVSRKRIKPFHPPLVMNNEPIKEVLSHKHLGLFLSNDGKWHEHINYITSKAWSRIYVMRKLKFLLDRRSLETIYVSFIRPLLEYADVVWDNCTRYEVEAIEKIQLEAARIVTGTTKLVSIEELYNETGWETLEKRRTKHKLSLFYKMNNNMTPEYLSNLVPQPIETATNYNLRHVTVHQPLSNSGLYYDSFIPSSIRLWNELPSEARDATTFTSFKYQINKNIKKPPKYYLVGDRYAQIQHTRLRTSCSSLNQHLVSKNIVQDKHCVCGSIETTKHYLLECPRYTAARTEMLDTISRICTPNLNCLLVGNNQLNLNSNTDIFLAVQKYIVASKRFQS